MRFLGDEYASEKRAVAKGMSADGSAKTLKFPQYREYRHYRVREHDIRPNEDGSGGTLSEATAPPRTTDTHGSGFRDQSFTFDDQNAVTDPAIKFEIGEENIFALNQCLSHTFIEADAWLEAHNEFRYLS